MRITHSGIGAQLNFRLTICPPGTTISHHDASITVWWLAIA